jgi:uncharacterized protein (TIGR02300 family)
MEASLPLGFRAVWSARREARRPGRDSTVADGRHPARHGAISGFDTAESSRYGEPAQNEEAQVPVATADLGTKRLCPSCGARYYDLNKSPILCPRCGTQFEVPTGRSSRAAPAPKPVVEDEEVEVETEAEVISLEEAEEETAGTPDEAEEGDDAEAAEVEEDVFLEEEEEEGDDVSTIIGDVDEEER